MKKTYIILFAFLFVPALTMAQNYPGKGTIDINGGIGVGHNLSGTGGIPLNLSLDYGYNENITFGGYLGFLTSTQRFFGGKWTYTNFIIGARGTYHHDLIDDVDTYGGLVLGYNVASAKWSGGGFAGNTASVGGLAYNIFVGGRYHFSENVGAFAELGYGIAILQFGITYRL